MAEINIAGVMRAGAYSPNHIGNDAAIFNLVAEQLRKRGAAVNVYSEEQLMAGRVKENIVVNMCREQGSIELLQRMEDNGALVINSAYGIENCTRERMTRILVGSGIPCPESLVVNTDEVVRDTLVRSKFTSCWIKRGDRHAMHKEDVTRARHPEEAQEVLQEYFMRGIKRAVISRHVSGTPVKFYGITDSTYFHWLLPYDITSDKQPISHKKQSSELPFDPELLKSICRKAAEELDITIFGGDCIVSDTDGSIQIIDFKDWPSFAPCRAEAAPHIARRIMSMIKEYNENSARK
ncbi:MAG: hypothetical protein NC043_01100 [Muribaculaceae bacterium]|nr:hypothetical protein [Muribaculaceae bacterium]